MSTPIQWSSKSVETRFWEKVERPTPDQCWRWVGNVNDQGYGVLRRPGTAATHRVWLAHRLSWEMHFGKIPDGLCVLHRCDNPSCVNPAHLFTGTREENNADKKAKGRQPHNIGSTNPNAKITEDKAREVRELVASGVTQMKVASIFGIKQPQVSRIVRGENWRNG
jgi:hypothetical protein